MTIRKRIPLLLLLSALIVLLNNQHATATHAQGADLTYQCLGNGQYQINLSFYRDCAGVNAPNTVDVDYSSINCGYNMTATLNRIANTGIEVTPICPTLATQCNGGTYPGVEEYKYSGTIWLPDMCTDWIFSFTVCCRNNAINTINNPGGEPIYLEAHLNNLDYPCNSSPTFSNPPVPFVCVGQQYCFNHGATDPDGDSLVYSLVDPATGPATNVTYLNGYSFQQPIQSNPAVTFNTANGDICMTPTQQEVTVMAVQVEEYRNGVLIGRVVRDIQIRAVNCTNNNPDLTGINGSNGFTASVCAGQTLTFDVFSNDPDAAQNLTVNWNQGIAGATFNDNGAQFPTGTFSWTPTVNDISPNPHCFTVTVTDDNCPMMGSQTYSYCITVGGFNMTTTANDANCGASNGSADVTITGGVPPVNYVWSINVGNNPNANGLGAGTYWVTATDAAGCSMTDTVVVGPGPAPGNIQLAAQDVPCFGAGTGEITANVNGGQGPYTYQWSNGATTQTNSNLGPGTYWVTITTGDGCITSDTATITQPAAPLDVNINNAQSPTCATSTDGSASALATGGTGPYAYSWTSNPVQNGQQLTNVGSGNYTVIVTDDNGCTANDAIQLNAPPPVFVDLASIEHVSCNGGNNGLAAVFANGGTPGYQYSWSHDPNLTVPQATNLTAGAYTVTVTDINGCTQTYPVQINEPTPITGGVLGSADVSCFGMQDGFAVADAQGGVAPYSYFWTGPVSGAGQTLQNLPPGWYTVNILDNNGCPLTDSVEIIEPSAISVDVSPDTMICPGEPVTLVANVTGGNGQNTYSWSNGTTTANSQVVNPTASSTYSVVVSDANGCSSLGDTIQVDVNDIQLVQFDVFGGGEICFGETASVEADVQGGSGNYTFQWNNNIGMGQGPHTVSPGVTTYYSVTVQDECNNTRLDSVQVIVHDLPTAGSPNVDTSACGAFSLQLANVGNNPNGTNYQWTIDGQTVTAANPTIFFDETDTLFINVTATTAFGCQASDVGVVVGTVFPQPLASFSPESFGVSIFNPEVDFNNQSVDADTYAWDFGDGNSSTVENPSHEYNSEGDYVVWLVASNQYGCIDSTSEIIRVNPEFTFYVPNAFTPDGDGVNDTFFGQGTHVRTYKMQIFNRWGELIFESNRIQNSWDGSVEGSKPAKTDVYVYKIQVEDEMGEHHDYLGHVSLLR